MTLYLYFALMLVISSAFLLWFWLKPLRDNHLNLTDSNIAIGKQKRYELNQDLTRGLLDNSEFEDANDEVAQTLAGELTQNITPDIQSNQQKNYWHIGFLLLFLLIFSLAIYQFLAPKLDKPNDFAGWRTLGSTLFELDKMDESLSAYEMAYQINSQNTSFLVEYASAILSAENKQENNQAKRSAVLLIQQALELDPKAVDALYLAGIIAVGERQFELAEKLWQRALSFTKTDSPEHLILENILVELTSVINADSADNSTSNITINITISPQILTSRADDFMLIYAKPAVGRPMPIAIKKMLVKDFASPLILSDDDALMPNRLLSDAIDIIIVVRLSSSGGAMISAGDLQVQSEPLVNTGNAVVNLKVE